MYSDIITESKNNFFNVRDTLKDKSVEELKEICRVSSRPFVVCALNIEGDLNIGMMIRTASLMGAEEFIVFGRRRIDNRSMVGANNYIPVEKINGLTGGDVLDKTAFTNMLAEKKLYPVFVEQGGINLQDVNWNVVGQKLLSYRICFVFGNESTGIPPEFLDNQYVISIPQVGVLRSLNVAASASMVLWDYVSHRYLSQ